MSELLMDSQSAYDRMRIEQVTKAVRAYAAAAVGKTRAAVAIDGQIDSELLARNQRAVHGLAWIATIAEAIVHTGRWALRLAEAGRLTEVDQRVTNIGLDNIQIPDSATPIHRQTISFLLLLSLNCGDYP